MQYANTYDDLITQAQSNGWSVKNVSDTTFVLTDRYITEDWIMVHFDHLSGKKKCDGGISSWGHHYGSYRDVAKIITL